MTRTAQPEVHATSDHYGGVGARLFATKVSKVSARDRGPRGRIVAFLTLGCSRVASRSGAVRPRLSARDPGSDHMSQILGSFLGRERLCVDRPPWTRRRSIIRLSSWAHKRHTGTVGQARAAMTNQHMTRASGRDVGYDRGRTAATRHRTEIQEMREFLRMLRARVVCPQIIDGMERFERLLDRAERDLEQGQDNAVTGFSGAAVRVVPVLVLRRCGSGEAPSAP